jgi:hypothetical protein
MVHAESSLSGDSTRLKDNRVAEALKIAETRNFDQFTIPLVNSNSDPILVPHLTFADSTEHYRAKALEYEEEVNRKDAFINNLNELSFLQFPVGLQKQVSGISYTVIISNVKVTPSGSFIEAYFMFELPQTGDKIAFRGTNIAFSNNGGFAGTGRLELVGNYPIKINEKTLLTILGMTGTAPSKSFVEFDCDGFKSMGIEGQVEFSRDLLIPEDEKGKQKPAPERVKTKFVTVVQSWSDLLLGVTLPPFQVNGLKDVGFTVQNAFLDWSDLANPSGMTFPAGYTSPFIQAGKPAMWQGFYLERLDVKLPASFAKKQGSGRVVIGVEKMILDDQGFTGKVFAENVLTAGDMSGWAYTIDRVGLELVINQVKGFELAGKISVPRIKSKDGEKATHFGYRAQKSADGNYIFAVSIENNLRLPLFVADINLYQGSSITVKEKDDKFYPTAILNGDLTIKAAKASFNQIRFEGMRISAEDPQFDIQTLGFGSSGDQSVSKFPVVISDISIKKEPQKIGIGFSVTINIGGKPSEEGFGGTAALIVWSKSEPQPVLGSEGQVIRTENEWKFDKVELSGVGINIKKPNAYELAGTIIFFDADPVYGDGFRGTLTGSISKFGGIQATALFGRTEKFRYWYADALVTLEGVGVPLIPGVLFATGFGGGFYSKMKQTDKSPGSKLGETKSGIFYVPDENTLGIKAIMNIGTARPEAMNGDVGLEVVMNRNGGINSVTLTGNANFMSLAKLAESKMKELASSAAAGKLVEKLAGLMKGQVYGSMKLMFDNENDIFHGNLEIYINVAGGLIRGVSSGNKAGWAVLHFEKTDWYVLIGTPDQPLGLEVARIFKSKSYFMLGKNLPGSPPPPSQVTEILGPVDLDYMRDMNALQSGTGFAFGLHFIVDTGDLKFLMFYGRFAAGTGLDFMLKDYGTQYHCEGSSGPFGINGWYANGQAYAFVMGKIGIKVNLRFYKGSYDIISLGAAAVLQTKGPNPFWMKGTVGGYYRILGGLVKGKCNFEVTVGKDCKPVGEQNLLEDVKMIAEISPANNSSDVNVFNSPQVAFNVPVGEIFEITDEQNRIHFFRATLDEFTVFDAGEQIQGVQQWNTESDVVVYDAHDILPGQKKLKARAKLTFEQKVNGVWTKVKFEGKVVEEIAETNFETGKAPDYIPENNVALSYPLAGQVNFYPREYNQGFIQLKDGQPYLFQPGPEWIQKIRMTDAGNQGYVETDLSYSQNERKVKFTIPAGFNNAKVYRFEILNIPKQSTVIDANVQKIQTELSPGDAGTATLTTKNIEGDVAKLDVKSIFGSTFRTSKYNTFIEKMNAVQLVPTVRVDLDVNVFQLASYVKGDELFDAAEFSGTMNSAQLIKMEALFTGNDWFQNYVNPIVYDGYPMMGRMRISNRNPDVLGLPPVRDIYFANISQNLQLGVNETAFSPVSFNREYLAYNLGQSVTADYRDILRHAVNYVVDYPSQSVARLTSLILAPMPYVRYGAYRLKLNYVIPGTNQVSSSFEWELFNDIPDTK